jgi:hypothetical protein
MRPKFSIPGALKARIQARSGARYLVVADVARFYPSIYSHSLPWAIHGKAQAKALRNNMGLIGNQIDEAVRSCQDGQTVGIPIGPDTSLLLAELILSFVDREVKSALPRVKGYRWIDDYEFSCRTVSEAEETLNTLQRTLADFELELSPTKTKIVDLPHPTGDRWVDALRRAPLRTYSANYGKDLVAAFDVAFETLASDPTAQPVKYLLGRIQRTRFSPPRWDLLQSLLLQSTAGEPDTLPAVLSIILTSHLRGHQVNLTEIDETLNAHIVFHAPRGDSLEVAWALWGLIAFRLPIDSHACDLALVMRDSLVGILLEDALTRQLLPATVASPIWPQHLHSSALIGDMWLYSYQSALSGQLGQAPSFALGHPFFRELLLAGVSFYDHRLTQNPRPPTRAAIFAQGSPVWDELVENDE